MQWHEELTYFAAGDYGKVLAEYESLDRNLALSLAETAHHALPDPAGVSDTMGWVLYREGEYLSFTTGSLNAGSTMVPLTGQTSTFGAGGSFNLTDTFNGGFTFTGSFSGAGWQCVGSRHLVAGKTNQWRGTWQFNGTLTNVVLTVNGQPITINGAATFQATAFNTLATTNKNGSISFVDTGGTTNFSVNVMPEPGTLALFGSGLIGIGALAKFSRQRKRNL